MAGRGDWGIADGWWGVDGRWRALDPATRAALEEAQGASEHPGGPPPGPPLWFVGQGDPERLLSPARLELEDGRTAPARARRLGRNRLELVLHEGRKRQVKRMCEAVGLPVTRLHRPSYGGLELGALHPGEWRELTKAEVERLRAATRTPSRRE